MDLPFRHELALMPDLRHRLRQLRWFRATFRSSAKVVSETFGVRFEIDEAKLTRAFLDWIEVMEAQKRFAAVDRADFIVFAAGLVLRELIRQAPAREISGLTDMIESEANAGTAEIVRFWPEGFLYTNYCVSAILAVHEQEFGTAPSIDKCADDLRTWWSYRENATEMPAYAVAFLDRFLGAEPNWITPDRAQSRQAMQRALGSTPVSEALRQL
ncbi:hypothetical protein FJW07_08360 [Mesorhizobium sp. B3-1-9]|uniref:hypothetical protein n=1 Tax=unclassified Mesorhizobium TaxID=325217 RepID=UPI00112E08D6|nr:MULTISPECIES: hypothetical protein [unclassified Mesorhizobium]TPI41251.1 hypothetical protein FJW07_08360 [Mesorhizobium sp. B3-1-9]TPI43970.1 hypothetical protein FJ414_03975 [Mesorhizobium sp. B3-1-6]TPI52617.1 hypothetical protein FJ417_26995 [Mesorhizobium sp. B3-1-7]UCI24275.1 hypothetical protein FJ430_22115 [Mesorhizobium sp. B2-8-5]